MIEQNVKVLRCDNDHLWVRMGGQSGCTACDNGEGCGAGLFAKLVQRKPVTLELARNELKVEAGQMLTLAFPGKVYMKLVLASYGWPLLAALAGGVAGHSLATWAKLQVVAVDVATLVAGVLAAWLALRFFKGRKTEETILNSLHTTNCIPSNSPNMCNGLPKKPKHQ